MKRRPQLPKLPYGAGTMFYNEKGDVVYKKMVYRADGSRFRKTIIDATAVECMRRMTKTEEDLLKDIGCITQKTDFREEIYYWLDNVKKNTLKTQSWERLESNVRINIIDSPIHRRMGCGPP